MNLARISKVLVAASALPKGNQNGMKRAYPVDTL